MTPSSDVTLVIPTYGRPELVAAAVGSALAQRVAFAEIVVVCDGPDPRVEAVLGGLDTSAVRVETIPHAGVAAARNRGVELTRTPWVAFLDDDDLLHPDYLAAVTAYRQAHPDAAAINTEYLTFAAAPMAGVDLVASDLDECLAAAARTLPVTDMAYLQITGASLALLLERLRGSMSTACLRRDVLLAAGAFPTGRSCAEDWTMYVNVARRTEWHVVPQRLAFFREHAATNTRTGRSANGLATVTAIHDFWTHPSPAPRPVGDYRRAYRATLRDALDVARLDRRWDRYRHIWSLSRTFLPRRSDRLAAAVPGGWWRAATAVRGRVTRRA